MLYVVNLNTSRGALEQDGTGVLGQRDGADEDHYRDKHARRRVGVEPGLGARLPDDDGGDDDTDVVDGVADDVDEDAEHAEVAARLLHLGHVVTVLCVGPNGLWCRLVLNDVPCHYVIICDTHVRFVRAAVPDRLEVHHGRLAVVMRMLMVVAVGIAMAVAVSSMRVIVAVVFCREGQRVFLSGVALGSRGSDHAQMPRL